LRNLKVGCCCCYCCYCCYRCCCLLFSCLLFIPSVVSTICVRQWRDVDAAREFRAFIHNGRLTACSQYCYYQCFPELVRDREELGQRIQHFFERRVLPAFPYKDAIVDLHVSDDNIEIIELSPYSHSVGACMFSWKTEEDRAVLENGPFELRILGQPKANPYECLPSKWRRFVCLVFCCCCCFSKISYHT
jgi:hypothetical protein